MRILCFFFLIPHFLQAAIMGGTEVTPSSYRITIKQIDFQALDGSFHNVFTGTQMVDLGSVLPGQTCACLAERRGLDPGSYLGVRVTFSRDLLIQASGIDGGQNLRTASGNSINGSAAGLSDCAFATADLNPSELQLVPVPTGPSVTSILNSRGIQEVGGDLQAFQSYPFTLPIGHYVTPNTRIDFDVDSAVELLSTGPGTGLVVALPPQIHISLTVK